MTNFSDRDRRFAEIYNDVENYPTLNDVARKLGVTRKTVKNTAAAIRERARKGKAPKLISRASVAKPGEAMVDPKIVHLQDQVNRLRNELKAVARDNLEAEQIRETIFKLAGVTAAPPDWLVTLKSGTSITGVPSTIWSDWHLGETVTLAETNGVNEFNLKVAERRIRRLVERTVALCFRHMTSPSYPGIVVNLIGDIVSGDIHQELQETNVDQLFPVILWARDRIIWALRVLADHFGKVFVACAPGNHGRMTKRPQAKRYVVKNADWLIYCLVERYFAEIGDSRVQFSIPATGQCRYNVFNHRYVALHGDDLGVKGGDGIIGAIGPIMRGEIKVHHSEAQIGRDYDTLLMGHWHQMLWLPRAIVNNSLKGYDEFARRMLRAPATAPGQALWFTHPTRGITAQWEIKLEDRIVDQTPAWVSWERELPYHVGQESVFV